MKIENIIEDIKHDIRELRDKLEEHLTIQSPGLHYTLSLPGIEELATIKSIAVSIQEDDITYFLSVQIHTHNGNRVFENATQQIVNDQVVACTREHPFQERFVELVREVIKKSKHKKKSDHRSRDIYNSGRLFACLA
jgi:hypothetical protein